MERHILAADHIHPAVRDQVAQHHRELVDEVRAAVAAHAVVVVGMAQNPFPRKVRALLKEKSIPFHYLEYGSYFSRWRDRTAIKMFTGWPTFPMVFVNGVLVGGFDDTKRLVESGELEKLIAAPRT